MSVDLQGVKLADTLLNTRIGAFEHPVRTGEMRTDMTREDFEKLRHMALNLLIEFNKQK